MAEHFANEVAVESELLPDSGLRWDHPRLRETAMNCFKQGWGNQETCKVTGLPGSVVSKYRAEYERGQKEHAKLLK